MDETTFMFSFLPSFFEYLAAFLHTSVADIRKNEVYNGYKNSPHYESGFGS